MRPFLRRGGATTTGAWRNQHTAEIGLQWRVAPHHEVAFATRAGLDGDSTGENWGFVISYIYEFEGLPSLGGK